MMTGTIGLCCEQYTMITYFTDACTSQTVLPHFGLGCTIGIKGCQTNDFTTSVTLFNFVINLVMTTGSWPTQSTMMYFSVAH